MLVLDAFAEIILCIDLVPTTMKSEFQLKMEQGISKRWS